MRIYNLEPRDTIHATSALSRGGHVMVSNNADFDNIRELK
jgi:predicted nucleic acid-binding protein